MERRKMTPKKPAVRMEMVAISELVPYEGNPRSASRAAISRLEKSLGEFGFVEPIIGWRDEEGRPLVIAGHQRLKAAAERGEKKVPVIIYPFKSRRQAVAYNVASNRLAELSDWDYPKLKENIELLDTGEIDLEVTGFSSEEMEGLISWAGKGYGEDKEMGEGSVKTENKCPKCG